MPDAERGAPTEASHRRFLRGIYSCAFWLFLFSTSATLFPIALLVWLLTLPFDRRKRVLHLFTCFWASLYTWFNPAWPVTLEGRDKLHSDRAVVFVSNHLSTIDIFVLFRLWTHFKWVSKIENFRLPFIGWNMSLNRYIKIERGRRASVMQMMRDAEANLRAGNSLMMFPEGTRSTSGHMREFKLGAFELALRADCPVQPILIRGTGDALPRRGFVLRGRHPIHVRVLDPIAPSSFAGCSAGDLSDRVRALMAAELGET